MKGMHGRHEIKRIYGALTCFVLADMHLSNIDLVLTNPTLVLRGERRAFKDSMVFSKIPDMMQV